MTTHAAEVRRPRHTYLDLVRRFPLRPIRSGRELDRASGVIDELLSRPRLDPDERDYLEVLSDLVERYEEKAHPIPPASDAELLAFLIEQKGVTQVEVSRAVGMPVSTVSEIVAGKRTVPRFKIGALAAFFNIEPAAFAFERGKV